MDGTQAGHDGDLRTLVEQLVERDRIRSEENGRLAERVEQLAERNAALAAEVRAGREAARPRLSRRLTVGLVSMLVLLVSLSPTVALAVIDLFGDVPTGAQFHDEINAIARAGITTGCSAGTPPNFCPDELVTRKAMAAFMSRGFGRVTGKSLPGVTAATTDVALSDWSTTITPGLPAGALSGAAGFIKADAFVDVFISSGTSPTCRYSAKLIIDGTAIGPSEMVLDPSSIFNMTLPLTGASKVTSSTAKTVEVRVRRISGDCVAVVSGYLTVIYAPFGGTGTNTL